jgi:hypothetical protein
MPALLSKSPSEGCARCSLVASALATAPALPGVEGDLHSQPCLYVGGPIGNHMRSDSRIHVKRGKAYSLS